MPTPSWARQHQPQQAQARGGNATNIGKSQNNHQKYIAGDYHEYKQENPNNSLSFKEFLQTVERERARVQERADRDKLEIEDHYLGQLDIALADYRALESTLADRDQTVASLDKELKSTQGEVKNSQRMRVLIPLFWRPITVTATVLLLVGTLLGVWLGWGRGAGGDGTTAGRETSTVAPTTPPPSAEPTKGPRQAAQDAAQAYVDLGDKNDADEMIKLVTDKFLYGTSEGPTEFRKTWTQTFQDIDALIAPGRDSLVEKGGDAVWIQVAWRRKEPEIDDIRRLPYDLDWWRMERRSDGYKLDQTEDGVPSSCAVADLVRCAQKDKFKLR